MLLQIPQGRGIWVLRSRYRPILLEEDPQFPVGWFGLDGLDTISISSSRTRTSIKTRTQTILANHAGTYHMLSVRTNSS